MKIKRRLTTVLLFSVSVMLTPTAARAQDEGQADLNQAIASKLTAKDYPGITKVVNLAQASLNKGLDEENTKVAKQLLASALMDRATLVSVAILDRQNPNPRWPQLRRAALADLKRLLGIDSNRPQAHYMIGRLLALSGGENAQAIEALDKAIDAEGADDQLRVKALTLRGNLQSDEAKRLADYTEAIKIMPNDPGPLRMRASYLLLRGNTDQAIADLDRALEVDAEDAATHEARGKAFFVKKSYDEALLCFDRALELNPKSASLRMQRGRVFAAQDNIKAAIVELNKAIEITPNDAKVMLQLGAYYISNEQPRHAINLFDTLLAKDGKNWQALHIQGDAYLGIGKQAEAVANYEAALKLQPENIGLLNNLSWVLATAPDEKLRDGSRALQLAIKACESTEYKHALILSIELGNDRHGSQLAKELDGYKAGKPWRELQSIEEREPEK